MKLYPRKLRNMKELERERRKVLLEKQELEEEGFFSTDGISGMAAGLSGRGGGFSLLSLLDFLPVSNPMLSIGIGIIRRWMERRKDRRNEQEDKGTPKTKEKSKVRSVLMDVAASYLKWKAVELSYKGLRKLAKARKEAKAQHV